MADVFEEYSEPFIMVKNDIVRQIKDPNAFFLYSILKTFANHSGEAHPSRERLAELVGKGTDSVDRSLKRLSELGLIEIFHRWRSEDSSSVSFSKDSVHRFQTSNGYVIRNQFGGRKNATRGAVKTRPGGPQKCDTNYNQLNYNQLNYINNPPTPRETSEVAEGRGVVGFDEFWNAYPKKAGKKSAKNAWDKAVNDGVGADVLVRCAGNFRVEMEGIDKKWVPHPSTWLNQRRWLDFMDSSSSETFRPIDSEVPF